MITVRFFGPLSVGVEGRTLGPRDLGGIKPKQLFELLVAERGRPVAKDRIAELLWAGGAGPKNVAATLETYVSVLRKQLRDVVVTEPGAYRIDARAIDLDLDRFDALRVRADAARRDADPTKRRAARKELEDAVALTSAGEVLADEPYGPWAVRLRETYGERLLRALVDAAELAIEDADADAALAAAERALARDRTAERAYRAAMRAQHALGRGDEALAIYQRCRAALAQELGAEPHRDTDALRDAIRRRDAAEVDAPAALRVTSGASGARREIPLLGRRGELDVLERAVASALDGRAAVLLVEGEAGVGKTRLLDELLQRVRPRHVGRAKCTALERDLAFAPLAEALRAIGGAALADARRFPGLGEIVPELGGEAVARTRAFEALVSFAQAHTPLVVVLDDLQWADASTLSALAYLARRARAAPLAVVGAFRGEEAPAAHAVRHLEATVHLQLQPLTRGELAPLGTGDIHEKTGGNALLLIEYLRALDDGQATPARLSEVVLARCRAAGAEAHRLAASASVLGRSFDPDALADLHGADRGTTLELLEELCARRLLVAAGERFDFRHDLIREALYASLSPARRRHLHGRALEALESRAVDAGVLAQHAELSGAHARAVRHAIDAGLAARARWANVESVAHFERALRVASEHPALLEAAEHERLLLRLGRALATIGHAERAAELVARARASAEARGDDPALFEALEALVFVKQHGASLPSEALAIGRAALEVARRIDDLAISSRALALVGSPAGSLGLFEESIASCKESVTCAERAGLPPPAMPLGRVALMLHFRGDEHEALAWAERAERAAERELAEDGVLMARWTRALALTDLGRCAEAWAALESIAEVGHGEETFWHARVPNTFGAVLATLCLYERALEHDLESLEATRRHAARPVREAELQTLLNLACDRLGLGRVAEARADVETVRRSAGDVEYARFRWIARMHWLDADVALAEGHADRALAAAEACLVVAAQYGQPKYAVRGGVSAARALAAQGNRRAALKRARDAARLADARGFVGLAWRAWWAAHEIGGGGGARARGDARRRAEAAVEAVAAGAGDRLRADFLRNVPVRR